jgi:DNA-binding response OmpR family regulator
MIIRLGNGAGNYLLETLKQWRYKVTLAEDLKLASQKLKDSPFNLIILDINVPSKDIGGIDVITEFIGSWFIKTAMIVLIPDSPEYGSLQDMMSSSDRLRVMRKPYNLGTIIFAMEELLEQDRPEMYLEADTPLTKDERNRLRAERQRQLSQRRLFNFLSNISPRVQ